MKTIGIVFMIVGILGNIITAIFVLSNGNLTPVFLVKAGTVGIISCLIMWLGTKIYK